MMRHKTPFQTKYHLCHGCVLESVPSAKYLWVTFAENLKLAEHINGIANKANQTLGFLKRNIQIHNRDLKSTAYKTLVRPQLEYASTVWSPHTDQVTNKLLSPSNGGQLDGLPMISDTLLGCQQCFRTDR